MKTDTRCKLLNTSILPKFFMSKIVLILNDNCRLLVT